VTPSMRPSVRALAAFDLLGQSARPLAGGQGRAWSVGSLVLKPVDDVVEAAWSADVLSVLVEDGFRVSRPVRSSTEEWVVDGWSAWERLSGEHVTEGRWMEVLDVGQKFNVALSEVMRPGFLDSRTHAWAVADRMAWGEQPVTVIHEVLRPLADRLSALLRPDDSQSQVIHGDLTHNVLFAPDLPPGVIDFTPYWRPARFCLAIVAVDAVLWHGAPKWLPDAVPGTDDRTSLLARAALRRLIASDRRAADGEAPTRDGYLRSTAVDHERVLRLLEKRPA
jgi:uncharacterized protein (TIGR02569 family)